MAKFTWDAMYDELTPYYGGIPLWQSTQDMLDAFWLSNGYEEPPQGDALLAFYVSQGAVGTFLGDAENDYWNRIGPSVLTNLGAVLVLDARNSKVGEQWALNMGSGGQVLRAKYGSVARAEIRNGVGLVTPDGSSGDLIEVPDSAAVSITGDFELVYRVEPDDWTPSASNRYPVAKRNTTGNQRSWLAEQVTDGRIIFRWSEDGITELVKISTASVPFADAVCGYVKITLDVDNGASGNTVTFYTAPDSGTEPLTWTMLGSPVVTAGVTSIFDSTAKITFGRWQDGGGLFGGTTKRVMLRNGIGGTKVLDVDFTKPADFATSFVCDTGQTVTVTAANAVDTNDPLFLPWTGENYVQFPVGANNMASFGNLPEINAITSSFEVCARLVKRSTAAQQQIFSKWSGLSVLNGTGGRPSVSIYNGSSEISTPCTVDWPVNDGVLHWVKIVFEADNGTNRVASYYWAPDSEIVPSSWTLVSQNTSTPTTIVHTAAGVTVGALPAGSQNYESPIYRVIVKGSIGGPIVLDVDFTKNTSQSSFVCTTGQTVTINRATSGRKTVVVTRPVWLFGTDDYMEVADNTLLDFGADEDLTLISVWRMHGAGGGFMAFMSKTNPDTYLTNGYLQGRNSGDRGTFFQAYLNDGLGHATTVAAQAYTDGAISVFASSRSGSTGSHVKNNGTPNTMGSVNASMANSQPFRLGQNPVGSGMPIDGECLAAAIFRRALTGTEIAQIVAAFGAA